MRLRSFLTGLAIWVVVLLLLLAACIVGFRLQRRVDFARQRDRVQSLEAAPGASAFLPDIVLPDDLPYNRIRMLATHNSYRGRAGALRLMFIDLAQNGQSARLDYGHPPLTEQLEAGIRSFEMDLRWGRRGFECSHVPLVDDRSPVPDFSLALREVRLWSERNPRAAPLVFLLELKDDYRFLDPALKEIGPAELDKLDAALREGLGPLLFRPDNLRSPGASLLESVRKWGWPDLADLRGRVIAILHANETYRAMYLSGHPALEGRAMFTSVLSPDDAREGDAVFAVLNDPVGRAEEIRRALGMGMIVRSRTDADGVRDPSIRAAALDSGTQILSTDYPAAYPARDGYFAAFDGGGTLSTQE